MTAPTSEDAIEVSKILADKLKPVYGFILAVIGAIATGVVQVYDIGVFIEKTRAHENQQDANMLLLKKMIEEHKEEGHKIHLDRDLQIIEILVDDLALLRAIQLETLPKKRRDEIRRQFEAQRLREIKLMTGRREKN